MPIDGDLDLNIKVSGAGATKEKAALRRMWVSASVRIATACGGWELGALPRKQNLKGQRGQRPVGQRLLTADTRITKVIRTFPLAGFPFRGIVLYYASSTSSFSVVVSS